MERVGSTVPNPIMKRTDFHNYLILREAFYNRKAFLTFASSPHELYMITYKKSYCREFPYAVVLFLFLLPLYGLAQNQQLETTYLKYLQQAKQDSFSLEARKRFLKIAFNSLNYTAVDSLRYSHISKIVEATAGLQDSTLFFDFAKEGYALAKALNKPTLLGDAHWNYGSYYLNEKEYDSSYGHYNSAYKYFTAANNEYYAGKMLYNMAYIAGQTHDYTGAEILLFRCIKMFERQHKAQQLYRCYNLLGNHSDDMEEFDTSLDYYKKAGQLLPYLENTPYYQLQHLNNLGVRLYKMNQFAKAIPYFEKALTHETILKTAPGLWAKLLDNLAFCEVSLGNYGNVAEAMKRAKTLRDSIGDMEGQATSNLHFASYYGKVGDTLRAIAFAKKALWISKEDFLTPEVLQALELLSELDGDHSVSYLEEHIQLDKSLNARDRNLRNKFTAIQYETDKYIAENERLFRQRLWLSIGAVTITVILLLIYGNSRQRAKNKELLFEREQQQYNEDMFLMALNQKTNWEKGRAEERQRISQELHDDIVSRLFTLRFRWNALKLAGEDEFTALHREYLGVLEVLETDIRNLSHELRHVLYTEAEDFLDVLESILRDKSEIANFTYQFQCTNPADWEALSYLTQINLRRLFEEVLQNVVKHAQATTVSINLYRDGDSLHISIADNGKGFSPTQVKKGIGIKNLENRSRKLNGSFAIHSTLNIGTIVNICIPIKTNEP